MEPPAADVEDNDSKRKYNYSFTINNWTELDLELLSTFAKKNCKYLIVGKEIGKETKTPHLQGHMDLLNASSITAVQKKFQALGIKKCPILPMKKNAKASRIYCRKDGDFIEHGAMPEQGKRSDLEAFRDDAKENPTMNMDHLLENHITVFARYSTFTRTVLNHYKRVETLNWIEPPNLFIWGPRGVGKSRPFQPPNSYSYPKDLNKWWDGYDGEADVLVEDIDLESCKYLTRYIKIWADRYPFLGQIKGAHMKIRPKRIIFTSNFSPEQLWSGENLEAILRRLKVQHVPTPLPWP